MSQQLEIKQAIQIFKPVHEVFEAIADNKKMSGYFLESGSGRLEEGKEIIWRFAEVDEDIPVRVAKVEKNKYVSYYWGDKGEETLCEIKLEAATYGSATVVHIKEGSREQDEEGIKWLQGNTEGWANFLTCLKAYCEYGINLRKGAFDFPKEEEL